VALLPGGVIGVASVDTKALLGSQFGAKTLAILSQRLPVPPSAGFNPERDLSHLYLGFYSMQGGRYFGRGGGHIR